MDGAVVRCGWPLMPKSCSIFVHCSATVTDDCCQQCKFVIRTLVFVDNRQLPVGVENITIAASAAG